MKKIITRIVILSLVGILIFSLFNIGKIYAEVDSFKIVDASVYEKSDTVEASISSYEKNVVKSNIVYHYIDDYMTYKLSIKNQDNNNYKIVTISDENNSDNVSYNYDKHKNEEFKSGSTKDFLIKAIYNNESKDINKREINNTVKLLFTLEDENGNIITEDIMLNPQTGDNIGIYLLLIIISLIGLILMAKNKNKRLKESLLLTLLFIPIAAKAISFGYSLTLENNIKLYDKLIASINIDGNKEERIITYGSKIGNIEIPEKDGYIFDNLYNEDEVFNVDSLITSDISITSKYKLIDYEITYDLNGGTANNPNTFTVEDSVTLNNPTKTGYNFSGWTGSNGDVLQTRVTIDKGTTGKKNYIANYSASDNVKYKVIHKYKNLDGTTEDEVENLIGTTDSTVRPQAKSKHGFDNPELQDLVINPDGSSTLEYTYERTMYNLNIIDRTYISSTSTENGSYPFGTEITLVASEREGYNFKWSDGDTNTTKIFTIDDNIELTPIYTLKTSVVSFMTNGGSSIEEQIIDYGSKVTRPIEDPTKEGYVFIGWYADDTYTTEFDFDSPIKSNTSIFAKFTNEFNITLDSNNGVIPETNGWEVNNNGTSATKKVTIGNTYGELPIPIREGFDFAGWYLIDGTSSIAINNNSLVYLNRDGILMAQWNEIVKYSLTLNNNGATTPGTTEIYEKYSQGFYLDSDLKNKMTDSENGITIPIKTGYFFEGYYYTETGSSPKIIDSDGKITSQANPLMYSSNSTLYARWTKMNYQNTTTGIYYETLQEAFAGSYYSQKPPVDNEQTIKIIADNFVDPYTPLLESKTGIKLDLNGKNVTFTDTQGGNILIRNNSSLEIFGSGSLISTDDYFFEVYSDSSLTITGDGIDNTSIISNGNVIDGAGPLIINNVSIGNTNTVDTNGSYIDHTQKRNYAIYVADDSTITNSKIYNTLTSSNNHVNCIGIGGSRGNILNMSSNILDCNNVGIYVNTSLSIDGDTINSRFGPAIYIENSQDTDSINISSGTITSRDDAGIYFLMGSLTITEGTITGATYGIMDFNASQPLTIGTDDEVVNSSEDSSPKIIATNSDGYGLYVNSRYSIVNMYDGVIKGGLGKSIYYEPYDAWQEDIERYRIKIPYGYGISKYTKDNSEIAILAKAKFVNGPTFNAMLKQLAGNENAEYSTVDTNITSFTKYDKLPSLSKLSTGTNVAEEGFAPIYVWYDNGAITWWSEDSDPALNEDSSNMFSHFKGLTSLDLTSFDTSNVTKMDFMFYDCSELTSLDISTFDTSNVTNMGAMFWGCTSLATLDLRNFNTTKVNNMGSMFRECQSLYDLNISSFNTSGVTKNMDYMFTNCRSLTTLDLSHFDTKNVKNMQYMFSDCVNLTSLNISSFNTGQVKDMRHMFSNVALTTLNLSNFDTSNVTNMRFMFSGCTNLTTLNVSSFNTGLVEDMSSMFSDCSSVTEINVSSFNTASVKDMGHMFNDCHSLTSLDLSNFNTSNVTKNMDYMFAHCRSLTSLDLSKFDLSSASNIAYIIYDMPELKRFKTPKVYSNIDIISLPTTFYDTSNNSYISLDTNSPTETWIYKDLNDQGSNVSSSILSAFNKSSESKNMLIIPAVLTIIIVSGLIIYFVKKRKKKTIEK